MIVFNCPYIGNLDLTRNFNVETKMYSGFIIL